MASVHVYTHAHVHMRLHMCICACTCHAHAYAHMHNGVSPCIVKKSRSPLCVIYASMLAVRLRPQTTPSWFSQMVLSQGFDH